jgi:Fe2+ or Zn2+ uptake regulation protein
MSNRPRIRETRQRRVVYESVRNTTSHPTAEWIFEHVRQTLPKISLGTVYRNLSVLKEEGMIREVWAHDRRAHYEACCEPHAHFICTGCGEIRDVHGQPSLEWRTLKELVGCEVREQRVEFAGLCARCQRRPQQLD